MNRIEDEMQRIAAQNREKAEWYQERKSQYQQNLVEFRDLMVAHSVPQDHAYRLTIKRRNVDQVMSKKRFRKPPVVVEDAYEAITCDFSVGVSGWVVDGHTYADTGESSGRILTPDLRLFSWEKFDEKWNVYRQQRVEYPGLQPHEVVTRYFGKGPVMVLRGEEDQDPFDVSNDNGSSKLANWANIHLGRWSL